MLALPQDVYDQAIAAGVKTTPQLQALVSILMPICDRLIKDYVGYEIEGPVTYAEYHPTRILTQSNQYDAGSAGFVLDGAGYVTPQTATNTLARTLILNQLPVISIVSVAEGGPNPTTIIPATSYYLDVESNGWCWDGMLHRYYGGWQRSIRSTLVTYTAGLTAAQITTNFPIFKHALVQATLKACGDAIAQIRYSQFGGQPQSVSIEDFSVSFANAGQIGGTGFAAGAANASELPVQVKVMLEKYRNLANLM